MIKKITAIGFLLIGGLGIIILLTYGGPVFPHIIGPAILALAGGFLLTRNNRTKS